MTQIVPALVTCATTFLVVRATGSMRTEMPCPGVTCEKNTEQVFWECWRAALATHTPRWTENRRETACATLCAGVEARISEVRASASARKISSFGRDLSATESSSPDGPSETTQHLSHTSEHEQRVQLHILTPAGRRDIPRLSCPHPCSSSDRRGSVRRWRCPRTAQSRSCHPQRHIQRTPH